MDNYVNYVTEGPDSESINKSQPWTQLRPREDVIDTVIRYLLNTYTGGFVVDPEYTTTNKTYAIKGYKRKREIENVEEINQELLDSNPYL